MILHDHLRLPHFAPLDPNHFLPLPHLVAATVRLFSTIAKSRLASTIAVVLFIRPKD